MMKNELGFPVTPFELKIEITRACNLECSFCYLGDPGLWRQERHMPEQEVLAWIDWAVENNIPGVRFTGGEATLHPKIELFCNYAHLRDRYIILNTNGTADDQLYDSLLFHDLRVSVPSLDPGRVDEMTGQSGILEKKLKLIRRMAAAGDRRVFMLTCISPELLGSLEEFVKLAVDTPGLIWGPLRYEASPTHPRPINGGHMQVLAEEISDLMDRYPDHVHGLFTAAPFCSVTPTSLGAKVIHGRMRTCGPAVSLNVNFKGNIEACFGIGEMGRVNTVEEVKTNPTVHACCSLSALPDECRACDYLDRCGGGCRKPAGLVEHKGKSVDYLAGFVRSPEAVAIK